MSNLITLSGSHGFVSESLKDLPAGTVINASSATFIQDNYAGDGGGNNPYPVLVYRAPGVVIEGGTILGQIDQTTDWRTVYDHGNSAGVRIEDAPNATIRDWRISDTWDAVRVSWNSPNFLIEDIWVTNARDDAVENDRLQTGTIRDSLFDGVFGGVSIDPSSSSPVDGHNETVTLDGVLMRLQRSNYQGEFTHASFIKTDSATPGTVTPHLRFINNVIAIEDPNHHSYRSLLDAWAHTVESKNNVYLNLSDTPLPSNYPKPPAGWTVLEGQAARDYWSSAKANWIAHHGDSSTPPPPPPPPTDSGTITPPPPPPADTGTVTPPPPPPPPADTGTITPTATSTTLKGTTGADTIVGNELNNLIDGKSGNDVLKGEGGNDTVRGGAGTDALWGGAGADVFAFNYTSDSRATNGVDTIMDFTRGDKIDLSHIDSNRNFLSDQAFTLSNGSTAAAGELVYAYDAGSGKTVINGNVDNDAEYEVTIMVSGNVALTSVDFIL